MIFIPDLERNPSYTIIQEGIAGDQHATEFRLGVLEDENKKASMSVALLDISEGICDIRFGYRLQDMEFEWKVTSMDYAITSKPAYIQRQDRQLVRKLICNAVVELVAYKEPLALTMSTFYKSLPLNALTKYAEIEASLHQNGWKTQSSYRGEDDINRWVFVR